MPDTKQIYESIDRAVHSLSTELEDRAAPGALWDEGERLTVSNTVLLLTASKYGDRTLARIQVQNEAIRFRYHGGDDPTQSTGSLANPRDQIILENHEEIVRFRMCASATDAIAEITYGRPA